MNKKLERKCPRKPPNLKWWWNKWFWRLGNAPFGLWVCGNERAWSGRWMNSHLFTNKSTQVCGSVTRPLTYKVTHPLWWSIKLQKPTRALTQVCECLCDLENIHTPCHTCVWEGVWGSERTFSAKIDRHTPIHTGVWLSKKYFDPKLWDTHPATRPFTHHSVECITSKNFPRFLNSRTKNPPNTLK